MARRAPEQLCQFCLMGSRELRECNTPTCATLLTLRSPRLWRAPCVSATDGAAACTWSGSTVSVYRSASFFLVAREPFRLKFAVSAIIYAALAREFTSSGSVCGLAVAGCVRPAARGNKMRHSNCQLRNFRALLVAAAGCSLSHGLVSSPLPLRHRTAAVRMAVAPQESSDREEGDMPKKEKRKEVSTLVPIDVQVLQNQLDAVRQLPRLRDRLELAQGMLRLDYEYEDKREPTFRRLFTHATWERYTGGPSLQRWIRLLIGWRQSTVLRAVWPTVLVISLWSALIAVAFPRGVLTARASAMALPLSLQGGAIGLLLVFRTNNAYDRLEEARDMWQELVYLSREVVSKCVVSLDFSVVCEVCRYLCALTWTLRDAVRSSKRRDDILQTLLTKDEAAWVGSQRSQPFAILTRVRRVLYEEFEKGKLPAHLHYVIEMDLAQIDKSIATCERLFSSPIPPNMARHGMRALVMWLLLLPVTLAGSVPPALIVLWAATTSYIFLGIDELGAQVEQPFKIMPLWQLCHLAQLNVEEALTSPSFTLRLDRKGRSKSQGSEGLFMDGTPVG